MEFLKRHFIVVALFCLAIGTVAYGSQNQLSAPTTGSLPGLTMVNDYNAALDSVNTCNSGATAPTNQLTGVPSASNCWDDTSVSGWISHKIYDGAQWVRAYWIDTTSHYYVPVVGGGVINSITSAATTDLCSVNPYYVQVSGTASITSFGSNCAVGQTKRVQFTGVMTLVYGASTIVLPTTANKTTASGDTADMVYVGSGVWVITNYANVNGAALSTNGLNITAASLAASAVDSLGMPVNAQIKQSFSGGVMTIALVANDTGSAPTSTHPILLNWNDQNTQGAAITASLTSSFSYAVGTAGSLGCATGTVCRVWFTAVCPQGSVVSGVCVSPTPGVSLQSQLSGNTFTCDPLVDDNVVNTSSTSGGGTNIGQIYATGATGHVRILGYVEAQWVSGTGWAASGTRAARLFGPGVPRPCTPTGNEVAATSTANTAFGTANSMSQLTPTVTLTPTSLLNYIEVHCAGSFGVTSSSAAANEIVALSKSGSFSQFGNAQNFYTGAAADINLGFTLDGIYQPPSTSAVTFAPWGGGQNSQTAVLNGNPLGISGATPTTQCSAKEIMGKLELPANDNGKLALKATG